MIRRIQKLLTHDKNMLLVYNWCINVWLCPSFLIFLIIEASNAEKFIDQKQFNIWSLKLHLRSRAHRIDMEEKHPDNQGQMNPGKYKKSLCIFLIFTNPITLYFCSASNWCLLTECTNCVSPVLKSDQFCVRCLATSTWSFPQRAPGWPRILGALPSAGNRALATQVSETKLRSCVTSNLSQMEKKLSRTLPLQVFLFYLVLKGSDISSWGFFLFCLSCHSRQDFLHF